MNFLEDIIKEKNVFLEQKKADLPQEKLIERLHYPLGESRFKGILKTPGLHLITEIKRASPSKGNLRSDLDVVEIAKIYEQEGVELVSVLTEEKFFKGSTRDILSVGENTNLSILCKDFIIDIYQIYEAKTCGADAVLLIVAILDQSQLREFIDVAKSLKMDVVVEVHNEAELKKALELGPDIEIIGINHRNLENFKIDLKVSEELLLKITDSKLIISESGIESASQIKSFKELGVNGVLIGESLMKEDDIAGKLKEFMSAIK